MPLGKRKTIVRAIRLDDELEGKLLSEAESRRITFNSLVNSVLYRHSEFDFYADRFGFITITKATFNAIVSASDDTTLRTIAREVSANALKEFNNFKYKEPGLKDYLDFVSILCNYGGLGAYEFKINGPNQKITIRHNLGRKASVFFGTLFAETIRLIMGSETTAEDSSENEVVLKFKATPFKP